MNLTKRTCFALVKQYVKGIDKVKLQKVENYFYSMRHKIKHFSFNVFDEVRDYCLHVIVENKIYGGCVLCVSLSCFDVSKFDDTYIESVCFCFDSDGVLNHSTNGKEYFDVIGIV